MAAGAGKPWRRASAGSYRSSDERFEIQSEGPGRWFLVDEQEHDELGLPRTLGPFATLDAAKEGAEAQRGRAAEASPLAGRMAAANRRPPAVPRTVGAPTSTRGDRTPRGGPAVPRATKPKTWLELLADRDAAAASRARNLITALVVEGMPPAAADEAVRRELVGGEPAIAQTRLDRAVADAVAQTVDRRNVRRIAQRLAAEADPDAAGTGLARAVAGDLVDRLTAILGAGGGHHAVLPGWALVERAPSRGKARRGADEAEPGREIRLWREVAEGTTRASRGRGRVQE